MSIFVPELYALGIVIENVYEIQHPDKRTDTKVGPNSVLRNLWYIVIRLPKTSLEEEELLTFMRMLGVCIQMWNKSRNSERITFDAQKTPSIKGNCQSPQPSHGKGTKKMQKVIFKCILWLSALYTLQRKLGRIRSFEINTFGHQVCVHGTEKRFDVRLQV